MGNIGVFFEIFPMQNLATFTQCQGLTPMFPMAIYLFFTTIRARVIRTLRRTTARELRSYGAVAVRSSLCATELRKRERSNHRVTDCIRKLQ